MFSAIIFIIFKLMALFDDDYYYYKWRNMTLITSVGGIFSLEWVYE